MSGVTPRFGKFVACFDKRSMTSGVGTVYAFSMRAAMIGAAVKSG
jgi:hypothetical protein